MSFFLEDSNISYIFQDFEILNILFFFGLGFFRNNFTYLSLGRKIIVYIVSYVHNFSSEFEGKFIIYK